MSNTHVERMSEPSHSGPEKSVFIKCRLPMSPGCQMDGLMFYFICGDIQKHESLWSSCEKRSQEN